MDIDIDVNVDEEEFEEGYYDLPETDLDSSECESVIDVFEESYYDSPEVDLDSSSEYDIGDEVDYFGFYDSEEEEEEEEEDDILWEEDFEIDTADPNVDEAYGGCLDDELAFEHHFIEFSNILYEGHDVYKVREDCQQMNHFEFFYYPYYLFFSQNVEKLKGHLLQLLLFSFKIVHEHERGNWPLIKVRECAIILLIESKKLAHMYEDNGYGVMLTDHGQFEIYLKSLREEKGLCAIIKLLTYHQDISMRMLLVTDIVWCLMHRIVNYFEKKHLTLCNISAHFFLSGFGRAFPSINAIDDDGIQ